MARITFALLLLAAAGAVFFFGVAPTWQSVRALQADVNDSLSVRDELLSIQQKRDDLTQSYNQISSEDLAKLSSILPAGFGTSQFLREMEVLAGNRSMFVKNIDFLKADKPASGPIQLSSQRLYAPIGISFGVRGTYESFRSFLRDMENMVRVTDIAEISFTASAGTGGSPVLDYAMKGTIYYLR